MNMIMTVMTITQAGKEKLVDELTLLKGIKRKELDQQIKHRSDGLFCSNYLLRPIAKITIGISIKDKIPPPRDNISKLYPATTIPDIAPPVAPPSAINTSTVPCVLARVEGSVESTIRAVPLIKPKFQPKPSKISAIFI